MVNVKYISSVEDLQNMGETGYYKLTKNIDCEDFDFESIPRFEGTLDGANHTVKNLKIHQGDALIDRCRNVTIKNIQFDKLNINGHDDCAGIINDLFGKCKFENVIIKNSIITGYYDVGGFVGYARSSSTITCSNCKLVNSKIIAKSKIVGGFVAHMYSSSSFSASGCVVDGALVESVESYEAGGFVGCVYSSSVLFNECDVNNSTVTARNWSVGGFVGSVDSSSVIVSNSVIENTKIVGSDFVGGFVGDVAESSKVVSVRDSVISGCKVSAKENCVGSIIGWGNNKNSVISNVPVLNTTVMKNKKQVSNKVDNIDISSTVRGHVSKVPSRKPVTRKPTSRKTTIRKPTARKTVGRVRVNYKKML